ncbi:MAG: hypothetical protein ACE5PV_16015 [Candidatus Poribacteria bacterium]
MRALTLIIEVDDKLDSITLLKSLFYPQNGFFKLTSVLDDLTFKSSRWLGLPVNRGEDEVILTDKELFVDKIYTGVPPDCYLGFNKVLEFLDEQIRGGYLVAQMFGTVRVILDDIGERDVFREVQKFECYYPETSTSDFRGSVWHQALFLPFWFAIEQLYNFYDVWIQFGSCLWFSHHPDYMEHPNPKSVKINFERLRRYLEHFFRNHLVYCRNVMINPDENPDNIKIAEEELKPALLTMLQGKINDIEILL